MAFSSSYDEQRDWPLEIFAERLSETPRFGRLVRLGLFRRCQTHRHDWIFQRKRTQVCALGDDRRYVRDRRTTGQRIWSSVA